MQQNKEKKSSNPDKQSSKVKEKKKTKKERKSTILSPRKTFTAHLYANPSSPTFNQLTQSFYHTYPDDSPRSLRYANIQANKLLHDKQFNKEVQKIYKEFMPNNKAEYNTEFIIELLKDELTSDNPGAVFAGKKELLTHMKSLTELYYKYGHNKDDEDSIESLDDATLLAKAKELTNLLSNNNNNEKTN